MKSKCENASLLNMITGILVFACFFLLVWILTNQIKDHYAMFDPKLLELRKKLRVHFPELINKTTAHCGDSSYTLDKTKVYLCLRDEKGNYYSDNTLMHVYLHELAHVKTHNIGHTHEFHKNFQEMLDKAESVGLYDSSIEVPDNYSKTSGSCKCT
jgi:hypothetical protein